MKLHSEPRVKGMPLLGTYAVGSLEDLELARDVGMNVVIGTHEMLDTGTPVGEFCHENGIGVLHHLTRHIYGMPTIGDAIDPRQTEIPLSTRPARELPSPGVIQLDDELIRYEEFTPTCLRGCERGYDGTEADGHNEGIFVFMPEGCAKDVRGARDSPNLLGYYVLDDSPGDCLSALKAMYKVVWEEDGGADHRMVCAGYGSAGALHNFAPDVCDLMLIYWYPVSSSGYDRPMIAQEVQWMLTEARARVPGIPFVGVYQTYWGNGAGQPSPRQIREQCEDFVREGASGLIAFACRINHPLSGWSSSRPIMDEMASIHEEIATTGGLDVPPEPEELSRIRVQPTGFWEKPQLIPGVVPNFLVVGPFDDRERRILDATFPPDESLDFNATYEGKFGPIHWIPRRTVAGSIGLGEIFGVQSITSHCAAYATCTVKSPGERDVLMKLGSDDDVLVRLEGKEVWRHEGIRGVKRDDDVVPLRLPPGSSRILVKVSNRIGMWGFFMRFTDPEGRPCGDIEFLT